MTRVLLIEDNGDLAATLWDYLESHGFTVDHASGGMRGLHLALTGDHDLVVLDLGLPKFDGPGPRFDGADRGHHDGPQIRRLPSTPERGLQSRRFLQGPPAPEFSEWRDGGIAAVVTPFIAEYGDFRKSIRNGRYRAIDIPSNTLPLRRDRAGPGGLSDHVLGFGTIQTAS